MTAAAAPSASPRAFARTARGVPAAASRATVEREPAAVAVVALAAAWHADLVRASAGNATAPVEVAPRAGAQVEVAQVEVAQVEVLYRLQSHTMCGLVLP